MSLEFDVVVIGAGPGGYIAAIRAAQLGLKVACIEKWKNPAGKNALGGTCLNVGCIPSKALLASSESYEHAKHGLDGHGITVKDVSIDIRKMLERKDAIVSKMTQGIEFLFRKNKITWLKGHGRFIGREGEAVRLELQPDEGEYEIIQARNVIIATGKNGQSEIDNIADPRYKQLKNLLCGLALELAQAIVRDGEGATKFITIEVCNAESRDEARQAAYAVARSPLVKTAFFASDPNLGRLLAAVGCSGVDLDCNTLKMWLNGVLVAEKGGRAAGYTEEQGQAVMNESEITVRIDLQRGREQAAVYTCDLSHDYVSINADYRS